MADNSILTPGYQDQIQTPSTPSPQEQYLVRDNFLSEYETEEEKSVIRENLDIPSKNDVISKQEANTQIYEQITKAIQEHVNIEDPHGILPIVAGLISNMVKTDGSTPFISPQTGVDPQSPQHLTTKKYVDQLIKQHIDTEDPHNILNQVQNYLQEYVKSSDVYTKDKLYTTDEIINLLKQYVKPDGSTPFTSAQIGIDPQIDSHLTTKRYVDKIMYTHKVESNPHNFLTILNDKLDTYAKKQDVYNKYQVYTKTEIDSQINRVVNNSIQNNIAEYTESINKEINNIYDQNYIKQDGSIPFTNPQKGVNAVDNNDLVTLEQLINLKEDIKDNSPIWKTSGPVETAVGFVEEGTDFPRQITVQEILDAMFYGQRVSIECAEVIDITKRCQVTMCIHGSTSLIERTELYQQGNIIGTFTKEQFIDGYLTVDSEPILEDTEFTFKVYCSDGTIYEATAFVKVMLPIFVGLLPKWKFASTITMDYLKELELQDSEGTQNRFIRKVNDKLPIKFTYKFQDPQLRHQFIVLPVEYPDLVSLTTSTQRFGIEAFDIIDQIPLHIDGLENDIIFKIYVYRQALSNLDQEVTYNFE